MLTALQVFRRLSRRLSGSNSSASAAFFDEQAPKWWDDKGELRLLRNMNRLRVPLIKQALTGTDQSTSPRPLLGRTILDIGCGGGLLSEPLARLGAKVTGIDESRASIEVAQQHAQNDPEIASNVTYMCGSLNDVLEKQYDCVVASEVVEHVQNQDDFVKKCCQVAKNSIVMTTLNRTHLSYALGIIAVEQILGWVPNGAHRWEDFVKPEELTEMLKKGGASVHLTHGMKLNPVTFEWKWSSNMDINYAILAIKKQPDVAQ